MNTSYQIIQHRTLSHIITQKCMILSTIHKTTSNQNKVQCNILGACYLIRRREMDGLKDNDWITGVILRYVQPNCRYAMD